MEEVDPKISSGDENASGGDVGELPAGEAESPGSAEGATRMSVEGQAVEATEEGSNTVLRPDSPDIISTYTTNDEPNYEISNEEVQTEDAGPAYDEAADGELGTTETASGQDTSAMDEPAGEDMNQPGRSRPESRQEEESQRDSATMASPSHEAEQDSHEAAAASSRASSRVGSAALAPPAEDAGPQGVSRNNSAASNTCPASQQSARPISQQDARPASQQSARPDSEQRARPESQQDVHPPSQQNTRPASRQSVQSPSQQDVRTASQQSFRPDSPLDARPASQQSSRQPSQQSDITPSTRRTSMAAPHEDPFPEAPEQEEMQSQQAAPAPVDPVTLEQLSPSQAGSRPASIGSHTNMKALDVEVYQGPDLPYKMMRVALDYSQQQQKSFLGGFKNKRTGAVYHHAWTQTPRAPKYQGVERKLERETQTVKIKQRSIQTTREASTQMERPGVLVDTSEDRYVTPGTYQTSEERLAIVVGATCTIQRFWRGYRGRVRAEYLRGKRVEREAFLREQERQAKQEAEEHRRKEIERRMHPRTAADFEILYNELEAWRLQKRILGGAKVWTCTADGALFCFETFHTSACADTPQETRKIKQAGLPQDKEQEVLQQLLHKETKLLQTIDRLKINANHENKDVRIQRTLAEMGKPKKFELKNGQTVDVHTPFTTRAMELMQLYNGLNLPMLTIDERLDVLLHVKWTVKEFECNLTRELVGLIEREADLLNRGRNPKLLEGLRKRISSLFLTFIETPEFNPESSRFQIVPMEFESYLFERLEKSRATASLGKLSSWDL